MDVCYGLPTDIGEWMALVRSVRWNFPGLETEESLEEHEATVVRFMNRRNAVCVKVDGKIAGVLLFSEKRNMICFLAVLPEHRRQGVASMLLDEALERLDRSKEVVVSTFCEWDEKGIAPRALYKRFGFIEGELAEELGYPVQRFALPPVAVKKENEK